MCGRFVLIAKPEDFEDQFGVPFNLNWDPSYNLAPGQCLPIAKYNSDKQQLAYSKAKWGLLPQWAKDDKFGFKTINARSESIFEKPTFRSAIKTKRCLIPANGYYEWRLENKIKQPYFFHFKQNTLFAFGGIWEERINQHGEFLETFSIVTHNAIGKLKAIHHRAPLILNQKHYDNWLAPKSITSGDLKILCDLSAHQDLNFHQVTPDMNRANFDKPECILEDQRSFGF